MPQISQQKNTLIVLLITFTIVAVEVAVSFNSALLPNLKGDLQISEQLTQWTVSIALLSLGISGLFYGALSDSFGRRPVLLFGLSLFCLGALATALAPDITWLLIARFVQGFGAGVGWIVGNATLKDLFDSKAYIRVMNQVHAMAGLVPAIAPAVGSYLGALIGWRACFVLIFIFSSIALFTKFRYLPETHLEREPISLSHMRQVYINLFTNRNYVTYLIIKVLSVMLIFCEIANVPLIYVEHYQIPESYYGLFMAPGAIVYIIASYISGRIAEKTEVDHILYLGLSSIILSNILILALGSFIDLSAITIQSMKLLTYLGWGLIFGNATGALISSAPKSAGAASALMIALEMVFSALGIYALGFFFNGTMVPLATFMVGVSVFNVLALYKGKD